MYFVLVTEGPEPSTAILGLCVSGPNRGVNGVFTSGFQPIQVAKIKHKLTRSWENWPSVLLSALQKVYTARTQER